MFSVWNWKLITSIYEKLSSTGIYLYQRFHVGSYRGGGLNFGWKTKHNHFCDLKQLANCWLVYKTFHDFHFSDFKTTATILQNLHPRKYHAIPLIIVLLKNCQSAFTQGYHNWIDFNHNVYNICHFAFRYANNKYFRNNACFEKKKWIK